MWCVIECSCDGEIFEPDFFDSKEEAAEFIKDDATECYENVSDLLIFLLNLMDFLPQ